MIHNHDSHQNDDFRPSTPQDRVLDNYMTHEPLIHLNPIKGLQYSRDGSRWVTEVSGRLKTGKEHRRVGHHMTHTVTIFLL